MGSEMCIRDSYSMDDESWTRRKEKVNQDLETNNRDAAMSGMINYLIQQGDAQPEMRKRFWASITNVYATVENSPLTPGQTLLPVGAQSIVDGLCGTFQDALIVAGASHPVFIEQVFRKHGKSGGGTYDNIESWASKQTDNLVAKPLRKAYSAHVKGDETVLRWDGEQNKKTGLLGITEPATEGEE